MKRKALVLLVVIAVVAASGSMISQTKHQAPKPEKAIDPVCGLSVDKVPDLSSTYKGQTYYFCSKKDRDLFKVSPEKYLKKAASGR
jgi:YHS domain-containing protein